MGRKKRKRNEAKPGAAGGPRGETRRAPVPGRRVWAMRLVSLVAGPLVFFGLLEGGLRLSGYGYPTAFLVRLEGGGGSYVTNEQFGWRFFPRAIARKPAPCVLAAKKDPEACRIFILGSSAAMGTPEPAFGFGRILEVMLRERYPGVRFEVVNAAMTAVNSHVVREIARDCARHEPDVFVVYLGNNEVVGPYGPGTVFAGYLPSLWAIRASLWAKGTRTGELVGAALRGLGSGEGSARQWSGMEMFHRSHVSADDARLKGVYAYLRANLEDICRAGREAGAGVVVCTVATNLRDCPPFASVHRAGLSEAEKARWEGMYASGVALEEAGKHAEAAARYAEAAAIDEGYAELQFRLARCREAAGDYEGARAHFERARDLDGLRFRADSAINGVIREVAAAQSGAGVRLADAQRAMGESAQSPHGIPGEGLFWEHVHPNFSGNYVVARSVLAEVRAVLPERVRGRAKAGADVPTEAACAALLALAPSDVRSMAGDVADMTSRPPFTCQMGHEADQARREKRVRDLGAAITPKVVEESVAAARRAVERAPEDLMLRVRLGLLLDDAGDYAGAVGQWQRVQRAMPWHMPLKTMIGRTLIKAGRIEEGVASYEEAMRQEPEDARTRCGLGAALLKAGRAAQAEGYLREAVRLNPEHATAQTDLGIALSMQGKMEEAVAAFRAALRLKPDAAAHFNLAGALTKQRHWAEAAAEYRATLAMDGEQVEALNNLGAILMAQGDAKAAAGHFEEAVRLSPAYARGHYNLGEAMTRLGQAGRAAAAYRRAVELKEDWAAAACRLAWLLATSEDAAARNGEEAVRLAEAVRRQTGGREPVVLDVLSAAYAEAGRMDDAAEAAEAAGRMARAGRMAPLAEEIEKHAAAYRLGKPYRSPAGNVYP